MTNILLALAIPAMAADFKTAKPVNLDKLNSEIEAAGCVLTGDRSYTINGTTTISLAAPCPAISSIVDAHVYRDQKVTRQALLDELAAIEIKLDDGTATLSDIRRWAKLMMKLNGSARRP